MWSFFDWKNLDKEKRAKSPMGLSLNQLNCKDSNYLDLKTKTEKP